MQDEARLVHYRRQRAEAMEAVADADEGHVKHFDFDGDTRIDVTAEWRAKKQDEVDFLDRLIAAWERQSAKGN